MDGSAYLCALDNNSDITYSDANGCSGMTSGREVSDGSGSEDATEAIFDLLRIYKSADNEELVASNSLVLGPSLLPLLHQSRTIYASRRRRASFLDRDLFGEPAWDILLDLFISLLEGKRLSVSSCCIASACPTTTGLRWIGQLENRGLIERLPSDTDKRSTYVVLTKKGALGVANCVMSVFQY